MMPMLRRKVVRRENHQRNLDEMINAAAHQEKTGVRLLWGTAKITSLVSVIGGS